MLAALAESLRLFKMVHYLPVGTASRDPITERCLQLLVLPQTPAGHVSMREVRSLGHDVSVDV